MSIDKYDFKVSYQLKDINIVFDRFFQDERSAGEYAQELQNEEICYINVRVYQAKWKELTGHTLLTDQM